ncbi:unnamed protein product [Triticum turgidum subsp. durum]|uniref:Methyltransferase type 11 domain-containing protein n=1 Tax=Triticum turgidum subsp. durum TaxID=4567 RepID=A0A9R0YJJ8_TRITD|nr:unnamed protein product [Triticum turgidum subsp. durum]
MALMICVPGGIEKLTMMDMSVDMVNRWRELESATEDGPEMNFIVGDEEYLPIKENSQDLIMSCLGLHWTNDLPGAMIQPVIANRCLYLDLLVSLVLMVTLGCTFQALELVEHLRAMAETNALFQRSPILERDTALATAAIYQSMFGLEDGTIPATFQVIYMTGWKEHSSQQKPKRRGFATVSFGDIRKQFGSNQD